MKRVFICNYEIFPAAVRCGVPTEITIRPIGREAAFPYDCHVKFIPMEISDYSYVEGMPAYDVIDVTPEDGALRFTYTFEEEQEWAVEVTPLDETLLATRRFPLYSLREDLHARLPLMGDLHVHSCCSDGKDSPAVVAANYRRAGFDFMTLTDHGKWQPSDDLIRFYESVPLDMKLYHGEEVHLDLNKGIVHIVNFGGDHSVGDAFFADKEKIRAEILAHAATLRLPAHVNPVEYAYREWIVNEIRRGGGISIFPHPFWIVGMGEYNARVPMTEYLLRSGLFDAFEVLGGQSVHENNMQTALWQDLRAEGVRIPIVGSSDSHGTEPNAWFDYTKTVIFAKENSLDGLKEALSSLMSVALETEKHEEPRVYGPFRLVKYCRFLLRYYFPYHNELCAEEGRLMKRYAAGDEDAAADLAHVKGRTEKYYRKFFGL